MHLGFIEPRAFEKCSVTWGRAQIERGTGCPASFVYSRGALSQEGSLQLSPGLIRKDGQCRGPDGPAHSLQAGGPAEGNSLGHLAPQALREDQAFWLCSISSWRE